MGMVLCKTWEKDSPKEEEKPKGKSKKKKRQADETRQETIKKKEGGT